MVRLSKTPCKRASSNASYHISGAVSTSYLCSCDFLRGWSVSPSDLFLRCISLVMFPFHIPVLFKSVYFCVFLSSPSIDSHDLYAEIRTSEAPAPPKWRVSRPYFHKSATPPSIHQFYPSCTVCRHGRQVSTSRHRIIVFFVIRPPLKFKLP